MISGAGAVCRPVGGRSVTGVKRNSRFGVAMLDATLRSVYRKAVGGAVISEQIEGPRDAVGEAEAGRWSYPRAAP